MNVFARYIRDTGKSIFMDIVGVFAVAAALLQAGPYDRLPKWAQPWDNDREPFGDTARYAELIGARLNGSWLKQLWLRYKWLGWRNPANNYGRSMGITDAPAGAYIRRNGDQLTSDQSRPGWKFNSLHNPLFDYESPDMLAFEFYLVWAYSDKRCLRVRLGWKLDSIDGTIPIVHVVNPFMPFTGIRKK
mgnify:CR=1 FL=1